MRATLNKDNAVSGSQRLGWLPVGSFIHKGVYHGKPKVELISWECLQQDWQEAHNRASSYSISHHINHQFSLTGTENLVTKTISLSIYQKEQNMRKTFLVAMKIKTAYIRVVMNYSVIYKCQELEPDFNFSSTPWLFFLHGQFYLVSWNSIFLFCEISTCIGFKWYQGPKNSALASYAHPNKWPKNRKVLNNRNFFPLNSGSKISNIHFQGLKLCIFAETFMDNLLISSSFPVSRDCYLPEPPSLPYSSHICFVCSRISPVSFW